MTIRRQLLLTIAAAFFTAGAHAGVLNPGRWEITIRTVHPSEMPPMTSEICISKEDAERPEPPKRKASDDCQVTGALHGNLLKYKTKCERGKSSSDAEFTYQGDRYDGVVTIKFESGEIRQIHSARRIGECEAPPQPVVIPPPPTPTGPGQ